MKSEKKCPCCKTEINESINVSDDGSVVCPECNVELPMYLNVSDSSNNEQVTKRQRSSNDIDNFIKKINQYEGIPPNNPPSDIEFKIDEYLLSYNYMTCKEIRSLPLNSDGRSRGNTSKKLLESILKKIKYQKLYAYAEWICHTYWGWVRHDISHLKSKLKSDYELSQTIVNNNKGDRKSNLNRDYRLYRHLEKLNYTKLDIKDFRIVKEKSLQYHEHIWIDIIVEELDWNKPPIMYNPKRITDMNY